jgi:hypothetical protein
MRKDGKMRDIKKVLVAAALALVLVASLAACSPGGTPAATEEPTNAPVATLPATEEPAVPTEAPTVPEPGDGAASAIVTGAWSDDGVTFVNAWADYAFDLPEGYSAMSQEAIDAILASMGPTADMVKYDCLLVNEGGEQYQFMFQDTSIVPGGDLYDADTFMEINKAQMTAMGYTLISDGPRVIGGVEYAGLSLSVAAAEDVEMYSDMYFRKLDGALLLITAIYFDGGQDAAGVFLDGVRAAA